MNLNYQSAQNLIQRSLWKYQLPEKQHTVTFKWLNPHPDASVNFGEAIVYSDAPLKINHQ